MSEVEELRARVAELETALGRVKHLAKNMTSSSKLCGPRETWENDRLHRKWASWRYGDGKDILRMIPKGIQVRDA